VEVFSGFEADGFTWSDGDFGTGARVASDACFAGLNGEDTESSQLDSVSLGERLLHGLEDRVDGCFGLGPDEPGSFDDALDEILFDQRGNLSMRRTDVGAGVRVRFPHFGLYGDGRKRGMECQSDCG
jgi:hypothetical protein